MDKPRHPQVFRPWKNEGMQKLRFQSPAKNDPRHAQEKKPGNAFVWKTPNP